MGIKTVRRVPKKAHRSRRILRPPGPSVAKRATATRAMARRRRTTTMRRRRRRSSRSRRRSVPRDTQRSPRRCWTSAACSSRPLAPRGPMRPPPRPPPRPSACVQARRPGFGVALSRVGQGRQRAARRARVHPRVMHPCTSWSGFTSGFFLFPFFEQGAGDAPARGGRQTRLGAGQGAARRTQKRKR